MTPDILCQLVIMAGIRIMRIRLRGFKQGRIANITLNNPLRDFISQKKCGSIAE